MFKFYSLKIEQRRHFSYQVLELKHEIVIVDIQKIKLWQIGRILIKIKIQLYFKTYFDKKKFSLFTGT